MRARAAFLLAASVTMAACGAHAQSQPPQPVRLALSLTPGSTYRYLVHTTGTMRSSQPGMSMSMAMDISMRQSYQVLSVDASSGVATVKVTIDHVEGKVGSASMPIPGAMPSFTVEVNKDGTVSGLGSDQYGSIGGGLPLANPAPLGGISPALPSGPVKPGDHWTKTSTIPGPPGQSAGQVTWDSQLLRFDSVNGTRVAVIESNFKAPMDQTIDASKLAQAAANASPPPGMPTPPPGASGYPFPSGFNPIVHLQGTSTGTITSWVDVATGRLLKQSGTSNSTMSESVQGLPSASPGSFSFGTGTSQMTEMQSVTVSPTS